MQKNNIKSANKAQAQKSQRSISSRPVIDFEEFELLPADEAAYLLRTPALQAIYEYYKNRYRADFESYQRYYEQGFRDTRVLCEIYANLRSVYFNAIDLVDDKYMLEVDAHDKGLDCFVTSLMYSIDIFPIAEEILMQYKDYIKEHGGA